MKKSTQRLLLALHLLMQEEMTPQRMRFKGVKSHKRSTSKTVKFKKNLGLAERKRRAQIKISPIKQIEQCLSRVSLLFMYTGHFSLSVTGKS